MDSGDIDSEVVPGSFLHGFFEELCHQLKLSWPLSLSMLFHYLIQPISIAFCGHLGKIELASVAMAISVIYVIVVSIGRGLAFGGDTFFAQTYGSSNKKNVGVYLQKGIIFAIMWCMPMIGILLNTESILILIRQDPDVARLAQVYIDFFMPAVFAYCCLFMVMRYLVCQNQVIPIFVICAVSCGVNAILNYGLIYQAHMGIKGSAIALMMTYYLVLILMLSYIWGMRIYSETWGGWSFKCLEDWGEFSMVTTSSICMTILFWLCSEIGTFVGGILSPRDLSAFSISFQIEGFAWMLPLGIGGACTVRLGQFLGANKPRAAANSAKVALVTVVIVSVGLAAIIYGCRYFIPQAFTSSKDLVDYTASVLRLTALFIVFEGFGGVCVGVVRGTGKQALGTIIVFVSWYLVAWPLGIPLMFATKLGLLGLWWGYNAGIIVEDIILFIFMIMLNWKKEAEKAVERSKVGSENRPNVIQPDETTGLIQDADSTNTAYGTSHSGSTGVNIVQNNYKSKIILQRLLTVFMFSLPLTAGILARLFVTVHVHSSTLCIPEQNTTMSFNLQKNNQMQNISLPYCVPDKFNVLLYSFYNV